MKVFNKVNCWLPGQAFMRILSLDLTRKKEIIMRTAFTLALLITVMLQISFAAGPVTGRVTDDKGLPLSGVNILLRGGLGGVITNIEGKYTIDVPAGEDSLIFSYVGFVIEYLLKPV